MNIHSCRRVLFYFSPDARTYEYPRTHVLPLEDIIFIMSTLLAITYSVREYHPLDFPATILYLDNGLP